MTPSPLSQLTDAYNRGELTRPRYRQARRDLLDAIVSGGPLPALPQSGDRKAQASQARRSGSAIPRKGKTFWFLGSGLVVVLLLIVVLVLPEQPSPPSLPTMPPPEPARVEAPRSPTDVAIETMTTLFTGANWSVASASRFLQIWDVLKPTEKDSLRQTPQYNDFVSRLHAAAAAKSSPHTTGDVTSRDAYLGIFAERLGIELPASVQVNASAQTGKEEMPSLEHGRTEQTVPGSAGVETPPVAVPEAGEGRVPADRPEGGSAAGARDGAGAADGQGWPSAAGAAIPVAEMPKIDDSGLDGGKKRLEVAVPGNRQHEEAAPSSPPPPSTTAPAAALPGQHPTVKAAVIDRTTVVKKEPAPVKPASVPEDKTPTLPAPVTVDPSREAAADRPDGGSAAGARDGAGAADGQGWPSAGRAREGGRPATVPVAVADVKAGSGDALGTATKNEESLPQGRTTPPAAAPAPKVIPSASLRALCDNSWLMPTGSVRYSVQVCLAGNDQGLAGLLRHLDDSRIKALRVFGDEPVWIVYCIDDGTAAEGGCPADATSRIEVYLADRPSGQDMVYLREKITRRR